MTRSQLITKVANDTGMTSGEVEKVMDCIFGTIGDVLKGGDKVTIAGFGRFEMRERQTKNFTNPKTKVTSKLEPTAIPGFKASGRLKEKVALIGSVSMILLYTPEVWNRMQQENGEDACYDVLEKLSRETVE